MIPLNKKNIEDIFALTPMQEGMLFHYLKNPASDYYFDQLSLEISGEINKERFEKAWKSVVDSNEMLRAIFQWEKVEKPIQITLKKHPLYPGFYDLSGKEAFEAQKHLDEIKKKDREKKFNLHSVPFRVTLVKSQENIYTMIISNHHILYDGWSSGIILKEFFESYEALSARKGNTVSRLRRNPKTKFKEFVRWMQNRDANKQIKYWKDYLKDLEPTTGETVKRRKIKEIKNTTDYRLKFPGEIKDRLKSFVKRNKITLSSLLYSAWGLLLQKYNSTKDIVYDTTVSGRSAKIKGIEEIVGLFVNTLPMRVKTTDNENISDFISRMHDTIQRWEEFTNSSRLDLKEYLETNNRQTIFNSVLVIENYPLDKTPIQENRNKKTELSVTRFSIFARAGYDLTVMITTVDDIEINLTYNKELFDEEIITALSCHFFHIVQTLIGNAQRKITGIKIASKEARFKILSNLKRNHLEEAESRTCAKADYAAPRDKIEEKLAEAWASVLNIEKDSIGIDANFFDFGGHSLKANVLTAKIHQIFNVKVPLVELFKQPTLEELANYIKKTGTGIEKKEDPYFSIAPVEKREYYQLSSAQERFYILEQLSPGTTLFNMPVFLSLKGNLDKKRLENAFNRLTRRHESLRTSFDVINGEPVQRIHNDVVFEIEYYETGSHHSSKNRIIHHSFIRPFGLSRVPLLRAALIKKEEQHYLLAVDIHHIVSDGSSQQVLARDFMAFMSGKELPPLRLQYKDYCQWQTHLIQAGKMSAHKAYWLKQLGGKLPKLNLATDFPRPALQSFDGNTLYIKPGKPLTRKLYTLIRHTGTTLYQVLLTVYNILLHKYTEQEDIIIGSPMAGRGHPDLEHIVGLIMEAVMLRNFPKKEKSFREFLQEVKQETLAAYEHQVYPYKELIRNLNCKNETSQDSITNLGLNVQNMFDTKSLQEQSTARETVYLLASDGEFYTPNTSKLDLTITAVDWGDPARDLTLEFEYRTTLFKQQTIKQWADHFVNILKKVIKNPGTRLWEIDLISDEEKQRLTGSDAVFHPLSHAQKRIYYWEKTFPATSVGSVAFTIRYPTRLDRSKLEKAINHVLRKHDALRLRIVELPSDPQPVQYISPYKKYTLEAVDISDTNDKERLEQWIRQDTKKAFHFINSDLFYFAYLVFDEKESGYYMKAHHIIVDGWTAHLLFDEIDRAYKDLESGKEPDGTPGPSYTRYLADERAYLCSRQFEKDREFWHRTLLPLPDEVSLTSKSLNYDNIKSSICRLAFPPGLSGRIDNYCKLHKTSDFKLIFSVLFIYISRVLESHDIVIGSASHNRTGDEQKKMAGMFVSTIPFRLQASPGIRFHQLVKNAGTRIDTIIKNHQRYPFDRLAVEIREITRADPRYLLNVNLIGHGHTREDKFKIKYYYTAYEADHLSLNLIRKADDGLEIDWVYQSALFSEREIRQMHHCLENILLHGLTNPGEKIAHVELLSPREREQILYRFNDTQVNYPKDKILHELFEKQAERAPDNTAVVYKNRELTYRRLNERANQLAFQLMMRGAGPDVIVGIMTRHRHHAITAVIAVLKSGAAFLPIDPGNPPARIRQVLEDSRTHLLLTSHHLEKDNLFTGEIIDMEDEGLYKENPAYPGRIKRNPRKPALTDLAYVIYTSGSTGTPRGVLVNQASYLNAAYAWAQEYRLLEMEVNLLQVANFTFDVFAGDLARVLVCGGKTIICPEETRTDPTALYELVRQHAVTLFESTPALVIPFMEYVHREKLPMDSLKLLILGSDICPVEDFNRLLIRFGQAMRIVNSYGVTEASIDTLYYERKSGEPLAGSIVPVGKPLPNMQVYILSSHNRLQPIGIVGELCIGGAGVSRGYLNNPELTAAKFDRDLWDYHDYRDGYHRSYKSYRSYISKNLYKTGDLARRLQDGNIELMGRSDHQVKIRGFRIEPQEIQWLLLKEPNLKDVLVIAIEDNNGDKHLCAYIVPSDSHTRERIDIQGLKRKLSNHLPGYTVPAQFVQMDQFPLNSSGKIDRKALPRPEFDAGQDYVAPRDKIEKKLVEIWGGILGRNRMDKAIGIDDNFFSLGGHSLKASSMLLKVRDEFHVKVPLTEIFKKPFIRDLAEFIKQADKNHYTSIQPVEKREYYLVSSSQKRMFIIYRLKGDDTSDNTPAALTIEGELDIERLKTVFQLLIKRHEMLRTSFEVIDESPVQRVHPSVEFEIEYYETGSHHSSKNRIIHNSFIRPFDLSQAPQLRVGLIKTRENEHILMIDMHHIIRDGSSTIVLINELIDLYRGVQLPPLRIQYKDFTLWQNKLSASGRIKKQQEYWQTVFSNKEEIPVLNFPTDFQRPPVQSFKGDCIEFELDPGQTDKIKTLISGRNVTLYMFFLAVYTILLSKYSHQEDIIVGTPTAGRPHSNLENMIGMFVNTVAMRNYPNGQKTFTQFLQEVKSNALRAYENQDYQFEELVNQLGIVPDPGRQTLFDTMFVVQNVNIKQIYKEIKGLIFKPFPLKEQVTQFDIMFHTFDDNEKIRFKLLYCTTLFKEKTIEIFIENFKEIISSVLDNPHIRLKSLNLSHKLVYAASTVPEGDFTF